MRVEHPSLAEAQKKLRAFRSEALPVTGWQRALFLHGDRPPTVPVLQVDARGRPDVLDLLRVHRLEGPSGDVETAWVFFNMGQPPIRAFLSVSWKRPVHCSFCLAFRFGRHDELLRLIAAAGWIGITAEPWRVGNTDLLRHTLVCLRLG